MSEDKKVVAETKLSLSEEMHLGFLQSIAKTNTEKITRETLEGLSGQRIEISEGGTSVQWDRRR
jgi:hypothetical protein